MNKFACKTLMLTLFSCLVAVSAMAEKHHDKDELPSYKSQKLDDNIYMLQGKGGNIAILTGEQGIFMVDDDYQVMSDSLKSTLAEFGGAKKVKYLLNTHWHGDHTGGNDAMGKFANIIAHDNVRKRLLTSQEIKLFGMKSEPYEEHALPSITYDKSLNLYINNEHIHVVHAPGGHTDGDSIVFFNNANIVHMGDHFFSGFFPFVDVANGGNVIQMAKNIEAVLPLISKDAQIIPGHGPLSTKPDLVAFKNMLLGTSKEVEKMKDAGKSLEQIQAVGLSKQWDQWANGFINTKTWISIVYSSLD